MWCALLRRWQSLETKAGTFHSFSLDSQNLFLGSMKYGCARWGKETGLLTDASSGAAKQHFNTSDFPRRNAMCHCLNYQVFGEPRVVSRNGPTKIVWGQAWPERSQEPGDIFLAKRLREMVQSYVSSVTPSLGILTAMQTQQGFAVPALDDRKLTAL